MSRGVECRELSATSQIHLAFVGNNLQSFRLRGKKFAEKGVHVVAKDPSRRRHQARGIGEVARSAFVHDNCCLRVGPGDISDPTRVIEVDMGNHHRGEIMGTDTESRQGGHHGGGAEGSSRFNESGPVSPNEVASGDARVPAHLRVYLEDVITEVNDPRLAGLFRRRIHRLILSDLFTGRFDGDDGVRGCLHRSCRPDVPG